MNQYIPMQAEIVDIDVESSNTYLISLKLLGHVDLSYTPGQFVMVSVMGLGECPISITSTPTRHTLQLCIRRAGRITNGIMDSRIGDVLGIRGPCGNGFPLKEMKKDILIAGGGSGFGGASIGLALGAGGALGVSAGICTAAGFVGFSATAPARS